MREASGQVLRARDEEIDWRSGEGEGLKMSLSEFTPLALVL